MKEVKEPEIKLFGRKIVLPENGKVVPVVVRGEPYDELSDDSSNGNSRGIDSDLCLDYKKVNGREQGEEDTRKADFEKQQNKQDHLAGEINETKPREKDLNPAASEELQSPDTLLDSTDNPRTPSIDEDPASGNPPKNENDQGDSTNSQQKTLKKPDKLLPCPRCNSMDTKFCYYNNYNINQPRHFCKSCQRYWTAGGTMRNVPVGAGRRKNKNSASHCRRITISEALHAARIDAPNGFHHPTFKPNGTVLSFGPDSPLCESMTSVMSLAEKKVPNGIRNGYCKIDQGASVSSKGGENGEDCSSGSSATTSNSMAEGVRNGLQEPMAKNINGFLAPVPCIPGVPWPSPWNFAVPLPAICPSGFPMPFFPAPVPYWNCGPPAAWNVPGLSVPSLANEKKSGSGPNSPLGKHSREGELLKPNNPEGRECVAQKNSGSSIVIPKTLRIDDPDEAAKSSIWATLGIKYGSVNREELFKALQPKSDEKKSVITTSHVLHANPAALSRSITFQESA